MRLLLLGSIWAVSRSRSGTTVFDVDSNNNENGTVSVLSVDTPNPDFASEVF